MKKKSRYKARRKPSSYQVTASYLFLITVALSILYSSPVVLATGWVASAWLYNKGS